MVRNGDDEYRRSSLFLEPRACCKKYCAVVMTNVVWSREVSTSNGGFTYPPDPFLERAV